MFPNYPVNPNGGQPQQPTGMGLPVPTNELEQWIGDALTAKIAAQADFTAYDITVQVRMDHPGRNVPHSDVRMYVHTYMQAVMANGAYSADLRSVPGGATAYVYFPL